MKKATLPTLLRVAAALAALAALGGGMALATVASADTTSTTNSPTATAQNGKAWHGDMDGGNILGTIASISGSSLTVTGKTRAGTSTTYTVDATSAQIMKFATGAKPAVATLADLKVGDSVMVKGTLSGTTVTAKGILDGVPAMGPGKGLGRRGAPMKMSGKMLGTSGKVTAVSGSTLTLTQKDGTTKTVNVVVGDMVNVIDAANVPAN